MANEKCSVCGKDGGIMPLGGVPFCCRECGRLRFPYQAIRDVVFIYPEPYPKRYGDSPIVISEKYRKFYSSGRGTILSVGPGHRNKKGWLRPMQLRVGDKVIYDKDVPWKIVVSDAVGEERIVVICGEQDVSMLCVSDTTLVEE